MRLKILLIAIVSFSFFKSWSQDQPGEESNSSYERQAPRASMNKGVFGKVIESKTNKGVDAASVEIFALKSNRGWKHRRTDSLAINRNWDSIRKTGGKSDSLIAGMLTKPNGEFNFLGLSLPDSFEIRVTALGYAENSRVVARDRSFRGSPNMDVGNIKLASNADLLGSVTVVAQRSTLQMGIDRKIFNVDKALTATGGTAVDVMKNIPSVTVDAEGNVQLRNNTPQIFIDGRPTILTLDQIPADDIERVELITNPSAKFDAATTGGIINIVMKKSRKLGINGIASAGIGTPDILSGNLSINARQGKVNLFASANYNRSGGVAKTESKRQNKSEGVVTDYFNQQSQNDRLRRFQNVRFGMDYFIDNRNTVTFTQNFVKGRFSNYETQSQQYLDINQELVQTGSRTSDGNAQFKRSHSQLNYTHNFPKKGMELTADVTFNTGNSFNRSLISNYYYHPDGSTALNPNFVRNNGDNENQQLIIQTDFVNPLSSKSKIEFGLRTFRQDNSNIYEAYSLNNATEVKLPLSNNVRYDESVHAAYVTYSNEWKGIRFQAGLRGEYSVFNGELVDSAEKFGYRLPEDIGHVFDGLFPSLFITKELDENRELQVNFSRRIRRPDFWQLNPFIDINDPMNITMGNPALRPEYMNSFELNYNHKYQSGNFLGVLYFNNNDDDITRYSDTISAEQYEKLNNAAIDPNAILNTFINAQYTNRMGAEFTLNQTFGKFEIIPNVNLQYRKVKAIVRDLNLSNQGFNWESKVMLNYRFGNVKGLFKNTTFQLSANYESKEIIPQGKNKEQFVSDFALRKEFLKNRAATITFALNDIFNTNRFGQIYDTDEFYQDSYRRWNVRNFRVTFSYRFGKNDFRMGQKENRMRSTDDD